MQTARFRTIARFILLLGVTVLVTPFLQHSVVAGSPTGTLDVAKIDMFVRDQVQRHGIPGLALALVDGDEIVHLGVYGKADETGRPVTAHTPFVLASASKPLTAVAVLQLVGAGRVQLDAPAQRYVPSFRVADPVASRKITLRHLLQHTSGIPERGCRSRVGSETLEHFVEELQTIELASEPGARHYYCSGNYNVLGRVIEMVSGQEFGDYMQEHVFAPLEMRNTFTAQREAQAAGLAQNYRWLFGLHLPYEFPFDPPQVPSGFMMSSAADMAHFLVALINDGRFGSSAVLSASGIAAMRTQSVSQGANGGLYGLGLVTDKIGGVTVIFHDGGHPNARTLMLFDPETRRGAVLLLNSFGMLADLTAFAEIKEGVVRMLFGLEPPPSSLSLPTLYLIVDAVLAVLLAMALWPLVRIRDWRERFEKQRAGKTLPTILFANLCWYFGAPLALLVAARLLLGVMGAQSWAEGFWLFPDLGLWLWAVSLVTMLTGAARLALAVRSQRVAHRT
jgi:CubicO group peptidase (beta-lactamase class C family)